MFKQVPPGLGFMLSEGREKPGFLRPVHTGFPLEFPGLVRGLDWLQDWKVVVFQRIGIKYTHLRSRLLELYLLLRPKQVLEAVM